MGDTYDERMRKQVAYIPLNGKAFIFGEDAARQARAWLDGNGRSDISVVAMSFKFDRDNLVPVLGDEMK